MITLMGLLNIKTENKRFIKCIVFIVNNILCTSENKFVFIIM